MDKKEIEFLSRLVKVAREFGIKITNTKGKI